MSGEQPRWRIDKVAVERCAGGVRAGVRCTAADRSFQTVQVRLGSTEPLRLGLIGACVDGINQDGGAGGGRLSGSVGDGSVKESVELSR